MIPASAIGAARVFIMMSGVTATPDGLRALLFKPTMASIILTTISDDPIITKRPRLSR